MQPENAEVISINNASIVIQNDDGKFNDIKSISLFVMSRNNNSAEGIINMSYKQQGNRE